MIGPWLMMGLMAAWTGMECPVPWAAVGIGVAIGVGIMVVIIVLGGGRR